MSQQTKSSEWPPVLPGAQRLMPRTGWRALNVREIVAAREVLWYLVLRDVQVRYKQTLLGAGWAIIQPLLTMVVFTIILGRLGKIPSDGVPYPVFAFCALLPWQLFAGALAGASNSLVQQSLLITRVYLPRLVIPLAAVLTGLADFAVTFVVLIGIMLWYGMVPGWPVLLLPLFILYALTAAFAIGIWLAALNVQYRDVRYTIPFLTQLWMFISPVAYPASMIPEKWRWLYGLNPMAGVIEAFRWAMLGTATPPGSWILVSVSITIIVLVSGLYYFRRLEGSFADRV